MAMIIAIFYQNFRCKLSKPSNIVPLYPIHRIINSRVHKALSANILSKIATINNQQD